MKRQLTHTKAQERKAQKRAGRVWQGLVDASLPPKVPPKVPMKSTKRRRFVRFPMLNVSFDVTQEVVAALNALRHTGLFGNGVDCASIAEELLRRALLDPAIAPYWKKPSNDHAEAFKKHKKHGPKGTT